MRRLVLPALAAVLALLTLLSTTYAQNPDANGFQEFRVPSGGGLMPESGFCYQPDLAEDACYINYGEFPFSAPHPISMTVSLQTPGNPTTRTLAKYVFGSLSDGTLLTYDAHGMGFRVACGEAGAAGDPETGNVYAIVFEVQESDGSISPSGGPVTCPAYVPQVPTAVGTNSFTAALDRLTRHQATFVALAVATGLLVNLLVPARLKQWRKRTE